MKPREVKADDTSNYLRVQHFQPLIPFKSQCKSYQEFHLGSNRRVVKSYGGRQQHNSRISSYYYRFRAFQPSLSDPNLARSSKRKFVDTRTHKCSPVDQTLDEFVSLLSLKSPIVVPMETFTNSTFPWIYPFRGSRHLLNWDQQSSGETQQRHKESGPHQKSEEL
jgi:hypothetical protein